MAITRRQIVTVGSAIYLLGLTVLAGYALHSANVYRLPITDILGTLTVALPILAGVALETVISLNEKLAAKGQLQASRIFQIVVAFFLIFETVLATLAGLHVAPPGSLNCALRSRWEEMFRLKDAGAIKTIQDAFSCCGLKSPRDMAFPFPDLAHGSDACMVRFEREGACLEPWRAEEKKVAIMLLVVPVAVFVWKVAIVLAPSSSSSWLPSQVRLPSEGSRDNVQAPPMPRPAIAYRDLEERGEEDSIHDEVNNLNNDCQLASRIEGDRSRQAKNRLHNEANAWRDGA